MTVLFLAWRESSTRTWFPVGRLLFEDGRYSFSYLQGALRAKEQRGFRPLESFPSLSEVYESDELFPLFRNRLPSPSRPDYAKFAEYLNVPHSADDPMVLLARSGGRRATDNLEVFPCPELDDSGQYHIHFFAHGVRHLPQGAIARIDTLRPGETLLLCWDFQNPHDTQALMLRTNDTASQAQDPYIVGYCPRYLSEDVLRLVGNCSDVHVAVERLNPAPAPLQFRLLCNMTACWPQDFHPFTGADYQPIECVAPGLTT